MTFIYIYGSKVKSFVVSVRPIPKIPYKSNMKKQIGMVSRFPIELSTCFQTCEDYLLFTSLDWSLRAVVVQTTSLINESTSDLQVAGGTGITPMLQVIDAILSNPEDNTQVHQLNFCVASIPFFLDVILSLQEREMILSGTGLSGI